MAKKNEDYKATGRRKSSVAQVTIKSGKGNIIVNGVDVKDYMPYETLVLDLKQPLDVTETVDKVDIDIKVKGGGFGGQTGAIKLGIARALLEFDPSLRDALKSAGFITRDARIKERKKPGLKKARKAPQFSKR